MIENTLLYNMPFECDALIYRKSGKYFSINERDASSDIFKELTGLDASDGAVVITKNGCAIFVDGRYTHAAKISVDSKKFEILDLDIITIAKWIEKKLSKNSKIAYDSKFFTHYSLKKLKNNLPQFRFEYTDLESLLDIVIKKRVLHIHHVNRLFPENKFSNIYDVIDKNKLDAYLLCDPSTISWVLNIRDLGSKYSPVVFGFLLVRNDRSMTLYIDNLYTEVSNKHDLDIKFEHDLPRDLKKINSIGIDEMETPSYFYHKNFVNIKNPCMLQKSIKNQIEINDTRVAAKKDSVAIINFLYWLYNSSLSCITELQVVEQILRFRKLQEGFVGESFPCIAAADENSSIVHYSPIAEHNKIIRNILLLDSGGQYQYGTTDITRAICINKVTDEQKLFYTLVLKGHIAVANAKIPIGSTGAQLDPLARQFLWNYSSDYEHATGHGIGYMLNVHEGPIGISRSNSVPLQPGMILSNEPAYYKENDFGIRLENMLLVKKEEKSDFLSFETISLVPFDLRFMDKKQLNDDEICWINDYHNRIIYELKNHLNEEVFNWLKAYSILP